MQVQNPQNYSQAQNTQQNQKAHQQQIHQQHLHQMQHQQQLIHQQHLQQLQQHQNQQGKQVKPQTPSPVHHQQQSPVHHQIQHQQNQHLLQQHHQQTQQHQQSQQNLHLQQLHHNQFQQQHGNQQLQQSQIQMSPQQHGHRSRQSTPDMSPRPSQRRNSSEGLMLSPNQDSQGGVRYRTPTPVSSAGETKTSTQSSQTQYNTELKTSNTQAQFGEADIKPNVQNMQLEKTNSMAGNFLAQGHHPRNLATEGGGVWDFESPKKEPEVGFSAMENFMNFAASLNNASQHLNRGQHSSQKQTTTKSSWHLPHNFRCKQEKIDPDVERKTFQKSVKSIKEENNWVEHSVDQKPARDAYGRYTWNGQNNVQAWSGRKEQELYKWGIDPHHPAYRGEAGFPWRHTGTADQQSFAVKIKPNYLRVPFGTDPRLHEPVEKVDEKNGEVKREPARFVFDGAGGPQWRGQQVGAWCCRKGGTEAPTAEHLKDCCRGLQTLDEILIEKEGGEGDKEWKTEPLSDPTTPIKTEPSEKPDDFREHLERLRNNVRTEVPSCSCFPPDGFPPEPGSYYTHLGAAPSLPDLRSDLEKRTGYKGNAIRMEKILYTGKEGKTTTGCPLAKWVIRRASLDEKFLVVVKHRPGHTCATAWIVVVLVAWEGVTSHDADHIYSMLSHKLNKFGLPTLRRCATNEPRTCACQGLDQDSCGASFSFGCSWSMYYNGCKYARSKIVRKFRLSVKTEEEEVEERLQGLATHLSPLYKSVAPASWHNQTQFEKEASECRLGTQPGRPFSGVTACIDFCAHAHRDLHNMNNGCTVVVTLTKHRSLSKPDDEQLHVLPLYVMDESDEFGNQQAQADKVTNGAIEVLTKFPCEVRVRAVPLTPCRRHGKKRKEEEAELLAKKESASQAVLQRSGEKGRNETAPDTRSSTPVCVQHDARTSTPSNVQSDTRTSTPLSQQEMTNVLDSMEAQLQSAQVSSTVLDSPGGSMYHPTWQHSGHSWLGTHPTGGGWENLDMRGEKIDADSTTNVASTPTTSTQSSNRLSSSPHMWYHSPHSSRVSPALASPTHSQRGMLTPSMKTSTATPPSLSPSSSNEWPYHESTWDLNSPSVSPQVSPFRVPRGRPPSRNNHSSSTPQSPTEPSPTFLKPFPPSSKDNQTHSETQTTSHRQSETIKCEFSQNLVVKSEFPNARSDLTNPWSVEKQLAWNDNFVQQSYTSVPPRSFPNNSTWPQEIPEGYQNPVNNNFHNEHSIKKESSYSWLGTQKSSENVSSYGSSSSSSPPVHVDKSWMEQGSGTLASDSIKREDGSSPFGYQGMSQFQLPRWDLYGPTPYVPMVPPEPAPPRSQPLGEVLDFVQNEECFRDSQMGGVAIALGHGSVLFECAKHELHATTALRKPNRMHPTRISLVFYQHRNLNRSRHGWEEWEQKCRLRKLGLTGTNANVTAAGSHLQCSAHMLLRSPTFTTTTWTTLFPMHPCMVTGPYQEGGTPG